MRDAMTRRDEAATESEKGARMGKRRETGKDLLGDRERYDVVKTENFRTAGVTRKSWMAMLTSTSHLPSAFG